MFNRGHWHGSRSLASHSYSPEIWSGAENDSICLERIYVKGSGEEIRVAWWTANASSTRVTSVCFAAAENAAGSFDTPTCSVSRSCGWETSALP
jgi:hypothetical protein